MKKVLVTGASGFIGRYVVKSLLSKGYKVSSISHTSTPSNFKELKQYELNLMNHEAVDSFLSAHNFENLIHLAWYVGPKCHTDNCNIDWVMASINLLKCFHKHGGQVFVGAGTISEYEYRYGYFLEDTTPTNPKTLYGECKNAFYKISETYCKQNNMAFKWPRIFNLYGPHEKPRRLMPSVICSCLKGEDVKVSDCSKFQDYLYVEDTANGIVSTFESEIQGAVNICSGQPVQLRTIVNKIAELTGFKGNILWGAIPAAFDDDVVVGNNEKLKSIGWKQKYSLEEGLKSTIDWWRNHNV